MMVAGSRKRVRRRPGAKPITDLLVAHEGATMSFAEIFPQVPKPIIGMLHLPPLPGSYNYTGQALDEIVDHAIQEADILATAGFDGVLLQNAGDRPASLEI